MKHDITPVKQPILLPLAIATMVFIAEGGVNYCIYIGLAHFFLGMIGHIAVCLGLISWPLLATIKGKDLTFPLLLTMLTVTMGIFGAGIFITTLTLYAFYARNSTSFADWYASLFPEDADTGKSQKIYERLVLGWDDFSEKSHSVPYMDIITLGTEQQRRGALDKITRHFTPELAPVLIKALEDPVNSVRIQAATILAKLEQGFSQNAALLEKKIKNTPNNAKSIQAILQLAKHYDNFSHAGFILDKDRENALRARAMELYERYLELQPDDKEVYFYLGRLYLKNKNITEAHSLLKACMEDKARITPALIWCYLECLYHKRDFEALKHEAKTYFSYLGQDEAESFKVMEMVRLWGGGILEPYSGEEIYEKTA